MAWLERFMARLAKVLGWQEEPLEDTTSPAQPSLPPTPPFMPSVPIEPDSIVYLWDTPAHCFHNTRVICDQIGLTVEEKDILCACVYQESEFLTNPKPNQNKDKTGKVWSTDWGIVQVNDYYQIGPKKTFPSVEYVLANPDACIKWMAGIMDKTGKLKPWASYTSKAYLQWLKPDSPMWRLKD